MKYIKEVLGRFYAVYALMLFIITMLLVLIPVWLGSLIRDEYRKTSVTLAGLRIWMGIYLPLIFCPVRKKGLQHFKKGETYVVVFNHNSMMDVPVSCPGVPGPSKTLAKKEMARVPLFGTIYRSGSILVDRSSNQSRRESFEEMKRVLQQGIHLSLYPEGTRNRSQHPLKSFYDGAFSVAIAAGKPILPALIFGTRNILPAGKFLYGWPHPIRLDFLEPIPTQGLTQKDVALLKEKVFRIMTDYYLRNS
jgi:1-acyl-sn-glycerol-3-phosphate acyltransferase